MRTLFWVVCAVGAVASVFACVSDPVVGDAGPIDSSMKQNGTEGAPCLPMDQCVSSLVCLSNICVRPPDSSMMNMDGGDGGPMGIDCGTPQSGMGIKCGAASCTSNELCCMANQTCMNKTADSSVCNQRWFCNNKSQCSGGVCCYQGGGTMGGCPITTTGIPTTSCMATESACEGASYRILCASNADCANSTVSTTCKPMKDPNGNIVGICSQ